MDRNGLILLKMRPMEFRFACNVMFRGVYKDLQLAR